MSKLYVPQNFLVHIQYFLKIKVWGLEKNKFQSDIFPEALW